MKKVLIPIANGTEELEAVAIIDILRRTNAKVIIASDENIVICSRGTKIIPDVKLSSIELDENFDAVILPGGIPGTDNLLNNSHLEKILLNQNSNNKLIGAICAAPIILSNHKLIDADYEVTSHFSVASQLQGFKYSFDKVVLSNNIITSKGAGTAIEFALKIVEHLYDHSKSNRIAKDIELT